MILLMEMITTVLMIPQMNSRVFIKRLSVSISIFIVILAFFITFYEGISSPRWIKALSFSNNNFIILAFSFIIKDLAFNLYKNKNSNKLINIVIIYSCISIIHDIWWTFSGSWSIWIDRIIIYVFLTYLISLLIWLRTTG